MKKETEVKIEIAKGDLEPIRKRLQELGAVAVVEATREDNFLFDFPDGRLQKAGCALRLRRFGEQRLLTFKGRVETGPPWKSRAEIETPVQDEVALQQILQQLGLTLHFHYSKVRAVFRLETGEGPVEICLDDTPVGFFLEIEGKAGAVRGAASRLGFSPETYVSKTYPELYAERLAGPNREGEQEEGKTTRPETREDTRQS